MFDVFAPGDEDIEDTHGRWLEREPGIWERADWDRERRVLTLAVRGPAGGRLSHSPGSSPSAGVS